jgi:nitrite reductase/ring-hydroxylating ferredoxin subunit
MRVRVGRLADLPDRRCVAIDDGRAVVVRVGEVVHAFANECLHQASPLAGGWVLGGVLVCPLHFWRYDVADGACRNGSGRLATHRVTIADGEVVVELPNRTDATSLRDRLLERARNYDRDEAWRSTRGGV